MGQTTNYIAVRVDDENSADQWWAEVSGKYPDFARSLRRNNAAVIDANLWNQLAELDGFEDGPEHAPTALIDCGSEGDQWTDVVAGSHATFEALS